MGFTETAVAVENLLPREFGPNLKLWFWLPILQIRPIRQRIFTSRAVDGKKIQRYRSAMDNLSQTLPDQEGPQAKETNIEWG